MKQVYGFSKVAVAFYYCWLLLVGVGTWPSTGGTGSTTAVVDALFLLPPPPSPKKLLQKLVIAKTVKKVAKTATVATVAAGAAGTAAAAVALAVQQQQQSNTNNTLFTVPPGRLQGQTIVITGASTGLGLETAKRLTAGQPQHIIITVRSPTKGDQALADVQSYMNKNNQDSTTNTTTKTKLSYKVIDLDDLQNIQSAIATEWTDVSQIDCLINNAGIMALPQRELTVDGIERQMQSNHLGHFVFTALLAPKFTNQARIITVSSEAHVLATLPPTSGMDFNYCWTGQPNYNGWKSYAQSKLANILFTQELQRRVDATQGRLNWKVATLHPGAVATDLGRYFMGVENWERLQKNDNTNNNKLLSSLLTTTSLLKTIPQGASTSVYLAAGGKDGTEDPRGRYYIDCQPVTLRSVAARNATAAKQLWDESEQKSGITFNLTSIEAMASSETTTRNTTATNTTTTAIVDDSFTEIPEEEDEDSEKEEEEKEEVSTDTTIVNVDVDDDDSSSSSSSKDATDPIEEDKEEENE
jgi:NAD(P)-dependent dehydrogenase (short-subunit alcohol dehydrogenase family)